MNRHTPGPWQYAFEGGTAAFIVDADGTTVCKLSVTKNSTAHSSLAANVRLIAAAPDLLAALKALVEDQRDASLPVLAQAREAIEKAEGEKNDL